MPQSTKRILLIHILTIISILSFAQKMSIEKAYSRLSNYNTNKLTLTDSPSDNLYIWNIGNDDGFIIVANDERIKDVLAYSNEGHFDTDDMPESMREWLDGWNEYIEKIQNDSLYFIISSINTSSSKSSINTPSITAATSLPAVSPLLHCKWNYSSPYNLQCPIYTGTTHSAVGCVGVALAQTLYYYKPLECKAIDGYTSNKNNIEIKIDDLTSTTFNWDIIQPIYKTTTGNSVNEIAKLMRYCSQACKSQYSSTTSAYLTDACEALKNTFCFSSSTKVINRSDYNSNNWHTILYKELSEGRPVIMTGFNNNSGHCFVCDGYDGEGLFHINWGWGGQGNGFFMIDNLNASLQGTSGYSNSYSMNNSAIIGIKKDDYHCSADEANSDGYGSFIDISVDNIEPYIGMEKVTYNITYKATIRNNGNTLSTPLYIYLDNSNTPVTAVGANIDRSSTGYAYFNVLFNTVGSHTITLRNTFNKTLYTKTVNIQDIPTYNISFKYSNITKVTNGKINQNSYSFKYYLINNSSQTYDDYVKFDLYKVVAVNDNGTPTKAIIMNTKMLPMNVATGSTGSCTCTFDDLDDGEQYYVQLQYISKVNGTVKWTGARTVFFTCNSSSSSIDNITTTAPLYPFSHTYTIDGKQIPTHHGFYITNGKKYIHK